MKIIITEDKVSKLKEILQHLINVELEELQDNSEAFDWDTQDMLASIDGIQIHHITYIDGIKVWVDIFGYSDEFDFDVITSEIQHILSKKFPHLKIFTNEFVNQNNLNEQVSEESEECVIDIDYTNFWFKYKMVYVNGVADTPDERERIITEIKENPNCKVILNNHITSETFELTSKDIFVTKTDSKAIYIWKDVFDIKIFPYFPDIVKFESNIKSANIKEAIEKAFQPPFSPKNYWVGESKTHVAGVVGILPIPGDENEWSIVNFFNTKESVHDRMKLFLVRDVKNNTFIYNEDDIKGSVITWMINLFKDVDSDDMKQLVEIQKKSIVNNFKQELRDAEKIRDILHPDSKINISGFGTKKDIILGIDVTIDNVTYQVKPLSNVSEKDGVYSVDIGMSNAVNYSKKPVDRMAFISGQKIYVFNNKPIATIGKIYKFDKADLIYPK